MADTGLGLAAPAEDFSGPINTVGQQYPRLAPYIANTVVSRGAPQTDGRQLEFYQPWEEENPTPGKLHVQVFDPKMTGQFLTDSVAADMLHHLGTTHPETEAPIDPDYYALKQQFSKTMTGAQHKTNQEAYEMDKKTYGDVGTFDDWMNNSRIDAYIRAGIFPQNNPEWAGFLSPDQAAIIEQMKAHLLSAPK